MALVMRQHKASSVCGMFLVPLQALSVITQHQVPSLGPPEEDLQRHSTQHLHHQLQGLKVGFVRHTTSSCVSAVPTSAEAAAAQL